MMLHQPLFTPTGQQPQVEQISLIAGRQSTSGMMKPLAALAKGDFIIRTDKKKKKPKQLSVGERED